MPVKFFDSPDASAEALRTIGGGSVHRPLSYEEFDSNFHNTFPYELTSDQIRCLEDVYKDL